MQWPLRPVVVVVVVAVVGGGGEWGPGRAKV